MTLTAAPDDDGRRIDRVLRKALGALPLSALHRLLRKGAILLDGNKAGPESRVAAGSVITLPEGVYAETAGTAPARAAGPPAQKPDILFEGAGLLVINKRAGDAVHGPLSGSLAERVGEYLKGTIQPSLSFKPGPLHRLDKGTSGVLVFSTSLEGAKRFSEALREGRIKKTYLAILEDAGGKAVPDEDFWEDSLVRDKNRRKTYVSKSANNRYSGVRVVGSPVKGARTALTVLGRAEYGGAKLLLARLLIETGRSHQIRAQAAYHGCPLWGDVKYAGKRQGGAAPPGGFFLHAASLEFPPGFGGPLRVEAPLPPDFAGMVKKLNLCIL
jgi:23S rRNA pseudouridine955/2504/2580 synthase